MISEIQELKTYYLLFVLNLYEHLYPLLRQEISRLLIQKPYQINVYKAGKRLSIMQSPAD